MNDLPPISFFAYLIITVLGCAAAAILAQVVLEKGKKSHKGRLAFVALFTLLAVGLYFGMRNGWVWLSRLNTSNSRSTPTPTPGITPSAPTPEATLSPTPPPMPTRESFADSFVRENIASPGKGLRRNGQWAVLISEPDSQENYSKLATVVTSAIAEAGHSTVAIFRSSATHGTGFDTLFAADPALSRRLNEYCDHMLLGKVRSSIQENPDYPGLHKVSMSIDIKIISTSSGDVQQIQTTAVGVDYDIGVARSNAEENLAANLRSELHKVIR